MDDFEGQFFDTDSLDDERPGRDVNSRVKGGSNEGSFGGEFVVSDEVGKRGGVVTARGTGDGVVLRLNGRSSGSEIKGAIVDFLTSRKGFLGGHEVMLEWYGKVPEQALVGEIKQLLVSQFEITVRDEIGEMDSSVGSVADSGASKSSVSTRGASGKVASLKVAPACGSMKGRKPTLFDGIEVLGESMRGAGAGNGEASDAERSNPAFDAAMWDEPDARMVYGTVRSGQKIETEHSLVILGDVNSGGELIAGGDIIVLGTLRGTAHAGAYDETGGGRVIFALNLQPTQLRIGGTISRGSADTGGVAEVARVEGTLIVVEPYTPRSALQRRVGR